MKQKEKEIKDIINNQDIIIKDMNNKILNFGATITNNEIEIKNLEDNYNKLLIKYEKDIKSLVDKIKMIKDKAFNIEMNFCPFCGEKYEIQSENNTIRFAGDKFKESPFFKNYYVQLFTQVKLLSKIGIIVGALLSGTLVLVFGISNTMSTESISSTFESMKAFINVCKIVPVVYYISLIACCFVCIFAIVNLLKEIEIKVFILALVTGINSLLLLGSMNTIKLISGLYSLDLSDVMEGNISSSLVNSAGRFIQDPEQAMKDLTIAFGFGFILLGYCIYLHIQCKKNNSQ
jgi:hypothetical protein